MSAGMNTHAVEPKRTSEQRLPRELRVIARILDHRQKRCPAAADRSRVASAPSDRFGLRSTRSTEGAVSSSPRPARGWVAQALVSAVPLGALHYSGSAQRDIQMTVADPNDRTGPPPKVIPYSVDSHSAIFWISASLGGASQA